jgi:four helix bundle protein
MNSNKKYDLEDRLIEFAISVISITENLHNTRAGNHFAGQLVMSGTSPALLYGEAQSAESKNDFIHKLKILLKELRETQVSLKIIRRAPLTDRFELVDSAINECNQLISIKRNKK